LVVAKAVRLVILRLNNTVTRRSGLATMFMPTEKSRRVDLLKLPSLNRS
jgi:hypothetical protein